MEKLVKDSLYRLNDRGELYSPNGKRIIPKDGIVNITKNGKNTRRTILSLMIETFDLEKDTIQLFEDDNWGIDNLVSITILKYYYTLDMLPIENKSFRGDVK